MDGRMSNLDFIPAGGLSHRVRAFDIQRLCDHTCSVESQNNHTEFYCKPLLGNIFDPVNCFTSCNY